VSVLPVINSISECATCDKLNQWHKVIFTSLAQCFMASDSFLEPYGFYSFNLNTREKHNLLLILNIVWHWMWKVIIICLRRCHLLGVKWAYTELGLGLFIAATQNPSMVKNCGILTRKCKINHKPFIFKFVNNFENMPYLLSRLKSLRHQFTLYCM